MSSIESRLHLCKPVRLLRSVLWCGVFVCGSPIAQAQSSSFTEEPGADWVRLGGFRGSTSSRLTQQLRDLFFEQESEGSLYRDLGAISLGAGVSFDDDDGKVDWDNNVFRRVYPVHEEIPYGRQVGAEDLSRYREVNTLVSRGRVSWDYLPDLVEEAGIGLRVEGGQSLTLARSHPPLLLGERPLDEAIAARGGIPRFLYNDQINWEKSLLRLGTEGIASVAGWIADRVGRRVETERGSIFFDDYGAPITLFLDLGLPVAAEMFTSADGRLAPGDWVRHVSFIGLVPAGMSLGKSGLRAEALRYYRFLRDTTVVKQEDDVVLVTVRNRYLKGEELTPLKIRPEVRLLGILKLGYTFFEILFDRSGTQTSEMVYRIDLDQPDGMKTFRRILQEGTRTQFDPDRVEDRSGVAVELLHDATRRGRRRAGSFRARFFDWISRRGVRSASRERIVAGGRETLEVTRARSISYERGLGKNRAWNRQFLIVARGDVESATTAPATASQSAVAISLLSSIYRRTASGEQVAEAVEVLRLVLPDPVETDELRELAENPPDRESRFFLSLRLELGREHFERLAEVSEAELWRELAGLLLGSESRDAWDTERKRSLWRAFPKRAAATLSGTEGGVERLAFDQKKLVEPKQRFKLASAMARRFRDIQRFWDEEGCLNCLARAFGKWRHIVGMQILISRLVSTSEDLDFGVDYEVFSDVMLRPISGGNRVRFSTAPSAPSGEEPRESSEWDDESVDALILQTSGRGRDWIGEDDFFQVSEPRLSGGTLYAKELSADGEPCAKLRLFSDLDFARELRLRLDLRPSGSADPTWLYSGQLPLGDPVPVVDTPLTTARYLYDVPLPRPDLLEAGRAYTLFLRVLNPEGYPVSEEQQIRFFLPEDRELCGITPPAPVEGRSAR